MKKKTHSGKKVSKKKQITTKKIILECESVLFYTNQDEDIFFSWLKKIKCISKIYGRGTVLYLEINSALISEDYLRNLFAIFFRYHINHKQLRQFITASNKSWAAQWMKQGPNLEAPKI